MGAERAGALGWRQLGVAIAGVKVLPGSSVERVTDGAGAGSRRCSSGCLSLRPVVRVGNSGELVSTGREEDPWGSTSGMVPRVCCRDEADEEDKEEIDRGAEEEDREETIEEDEEEDEEDEEWVEREAEEDGGTEVGIDWCSQSSSPKESPLSWYSSDRSWSSPRR